MTETLTPPTLPNELSATGLQCVVADRVLTVTLDNPPDNRLTASMLQGLDRALDRLEADDVDLLLLQGSKSCFSKGIDLTALSEGVDAVALREQLVLSNALFSRVARSRKPTIAAISGACLGGGFELALACHYRLCSDRARFGLPEIWIRLVPGLGGVYRLTQLVGPGKALELVTLGDLISAEDALKWNIVSRVFPKGEMGDRVASFLKALRMAEPHVLQEAIHLIQCTQRMGAEDNVRQGLESFARLAGSWTPPTTT